MLRFWLSLLNELAHQKGGKSISGFQEIFSEEAEPKLRYKEQAGSHGWESWWEVIVATAIAEGNVWGLAELGRWTESGTEGDLQETAESLRVGQGC